MRVSREKVRAGKKRRMGNKAGLESKNEQKAGSLVIWETGSFYVIFEKYTANLVSNLTV